MKKRRFPAGVCILGLFLSSLGGMAPAARSTEELTAGVLTEEVEGSDLGDLLWFDDPEVSLEVEDVSEADTSVPEKKYDEKPVTSLLLEGSAFESRTLVNNKNLYFAISSTDTDLSDGYTWQVDMKNRLDQSLAVLLEDTAVNGYMCALDGRGDAAWALPAGQKLSSEITWPKEELEKAGIESLWEIRLSIRSYTDNYKDFSRTWYDHSDITIQFLPGTGENNVILGTDVSSQLYAQGQQDLFAGDDYVFRILSWDAGTREEPAWTVYLENNSPDTVLFSLTNVLVNQMAEDMYWGEVVLSGSKAVVPISFWNLDLVENGIDMITRVDFDLQVWIRPQGAPDTYKNAKTYSHTVYPMGEVAANDYQRKTEEGDVVLLHTDSCDVLLPRVDESITATYSSVKLLYENHSDRKLTLIARTLSDELKTVIPAQSSKYVSILVPVESAAEDASEDETEAETENAKHSIKTAQAQLDLIIGEEGGTVSASQRFRIDTQTREILSREEIPEPEDAETEVPSGSDEKEKESEKDSGSSGKEAESEAAPGSVEKEEESEIASESAEKEEESEIASGSAEKEEESEIASESAEKETESEIASGSAEKETESGTALEPAEEETEPAAKDAGTGKAGMEEQASEAAEDETGVTEEAADEEKDTTEDAADSGEAEDTGKKNVNTIGAAKEEPETVRTAGSKPENASETEIETVTEGETEAEPVTESETEAEPATEKDAETEVGPETEAEPELEAEPEREAETEVETEPYLDNATVQNVQAALYEFGLDVVKVDGKVGDLTYGKILEFRKEHGLSEEARIDRELLEALGTAPGATCIKLQEALAREGYDIGKADGLVGQKTRAAIKSYKTSHGMESNGMIDRELLEALGIEWVY